MFGILTQGLERCPGRESLSMGVPTLERRCQSCLHRTWPATVNLAQMEPPKGHPCPQYVPPWAWGGEE